VNTEPRPLDVTTTEPLRASRVESEVVVPFAQTALTAILAAACIGLFAWRVEAGIFGVVVLAVWGWRIVRSDALMWRLERITNHDITGDGSIGAPDPMLTVYNPADARRKAAAAGLPVRNVERVRESLTAFVYLCASAPDGKPTEAALGIPTGDRAGYVAYRDKLIALGIADWDIPTRHSAGWHLCVTPEDAARIIAQHMV
jgi:hypothetical protein